MNDWQHNMHDYMKFGDEDIRNTISLNSNSLFGVADIFKINGSNHFKFYLISDNCYLADEWFRYIIIGKNSQGKWIYYFDTRKIAGRYFDSSHFGRGDYSPLYGLYFYDPEIKNDTIIIHYKESKDGKYITMGESEPGRHIEHGEFRFKWDEKAQWFSVEQVKY